MERECPNTTEKTYIVNGIAETFTMPCLHCDICMENMERERLADIAAENRAGINDVPFMFYVER